MKKVLSAILIGLFFSSVVNAAEVHVFGFELTEFQHRLLEQELERALPGAKVEFSIGRLQAYSTNEVVIRATIVHQGEVITGMNFFNRDDVFHSVRMALADALID